MTQAPLIVWFRRDFRLSDHEALYAACETGRPIIPVFILDEVFDALGAEPKWRLGLAIEYFKKKLESMGSNLILRRGNASEILQKLMNETGALDVCQLLNCHNFISYPSWLENAPLAEFGIWHFYIWHKHGVDLPRLPNLEFDYFIFRSGSI